MAPAKVYQKITAMTTYAQESMGNQSYPVKNMRFGDVSFSVASHTAWAPGVETPAAWLEWAHGRAHIAGSAEPSVRAMPPMLRRRASAAGKLALEAAYQCLPEPGDVPVIFASRHGECARSADLLMELAHNAPLSPTSFSLSVHNANAGLFSIARGNRSNHIAIAAGPDTVEHAVIEACGLLADGAPQVLLVMSDHSPPDVFAAYNDCTEQSFAWAWLMQPAANAANLKHNAKYSEQFSLSWSHADQPADHPVETHTDTAPSGLHVLRFFLRRDAELVRAANGRRWQWNRHV